MNNRTELEIWLDKMAAQADCESVHQEVAERIADKPWAQELWQNLLLENSSIRQELARVLIPEGIESRMIALASSEPPAVSIAETNVRSVRNIPLWALAVSAMLLVGIGISIGFLSRGSSRFQTVALLAINNHLNHLNDHNVNPKLEAPELLVQALASKVNFDVFLPAMDDRLELVGCRECKLGTRAVAFSLWRGDDGNYSLFQFQPDEFGIPNMVRSRWIRVNGPAGEEHPCGAWIWTDGKAGFVLVADPFCDLDSVRPVSKPGA